MADDRNQLVDFGLQIADCQKAQGNSSIGLESNRRNRRRRRIIKGKG